MAWHHALSAVEVEAKGAEKGTASLGTLALQGTEGMQSVLLLWGYDAERLAADPDPLATIEAALAMPGEVGPLLGDTIRMDEEGDGEAAALTGDGGEGEAEAASCTECDVLHGAVSKQAACLLAVGAVQHCYEPLADGGCSVGMQACPGTAEPLLRLDLKAEGLRVA